MGLQEDAQVTVLVADYVGVDAAGKLNLIGAGFAIMGVDPNTGTTPPFSLAAVIEAPARYVGQDFTVSIELRDETTGTVVQMVGPSGQPEALRIAQLAKFERPQYPPGVAVPDGLPLKIQLNIGFSNGLPLKPATLYHWRLDIDGEHRKSWGARFGVPGPLPGPVFGGPAGPSTIPNLPL